MKTASLKAATALLAIAIAMPAVAQEADDEASEGLVEIVVTAQRREESSQRAAVAIDVVSNATLENAGVVTATSLNAAVPSLYITRAGGANTSFFIRGVGNYTNNGYSDPAIAFNVDGVYYGRPTSTAGTFYDLERIEVLKGPQGTLYGRNATGGAINIIPAKPKLGELSGYASAGYGRFDARDAEGSINLPLGENAAIRASAKIFDSEGHYQDGTSDEVGEALRVQLLTELDERLTIRISGDYSHTGGIGTGGSFTGSLRPSPGSLATATSPANYTFTPSGLDPRSGLLSPAGRTYFANSVLGGPRINPEPLNTPFQDNEYFGFSAEIGYKTNFGTLTVIPAYRNSKIDNLFNGPAFRGGLIDETDDQVSLEARFNGERVGMFDWLVGGFHFNEQIDGQYTFSQYTVQSFQKFKTGTKSNAVFGRVTAHLSESLRLVGAARYTQDEKRFNGGATNLVQICTNPSGCIGGPSIPVATSYATLGALIPASLLPLGLPTLPGPPNSRPFGATGNRLFIIPIAINSVAKTSRLTYRVAAEYDAGPNSLLYASYETGYRSGGFNVSLGRESYLPEYITAITFGSKNRFFDNRLQVNLEAFRWQYRDQQVAHFGLDSTGNNSNFSENIGRSRIQGIDLDVQAKLAANTTIRGSVQYLENKLSSFIYDVSAASAPLVGCPFAPGIDKFGRPSFKVNCSGKPGFNSPKWASNVGIDQTIELGGHKIVLTADGRYRSNRVIGFEYLAQQNSGSDFTIDASIKFAEIDDKWALTAWVRNLTNETVPVFAQFAGSTGNNIVTSYSAPRTYGARLRYNF